MSNSAQCIAPTPRVRGLERPIIWVIGACVIAFPLLPRVGVIACAAALGTLTAVSLARRFRQASLVGAFFCTGITVALLGIGPSQLWLGLASAVVAALAAFVPGLRGAIGWFRRGRADPLSIALAAGFTAVAGIALVAWFVAFDPDVSDIVARFVPNVSLGWLLAGAAVFSLVNAAVEEIAYRGVLLQSFEAAFGPGLLALCVQAVAFGTLHIHGFPRGPIGVALATAYGLMMGVIRARSRGILLPYAAHAATDLAIATIVLLLAR